MAECPAGRRGPPSAAASEPHPWRRSDRPAAAGAGHWRATDRGDRGRQRIDGAIQPGPAVLRLWSRAQRGARGGVPVRHPADAGDAAADRAEGGRRVHAGRARSSGLGRRHTHRRGVAHVQPALGAARDPQWSDRADRVGWLGPRRSGAARSRARAHSPQLPPADLAQPAPRDDGVRAADAWHAGGIAARRRFSAGTESRQPSAARESPAQAAAAIQARAMAAGSTRGPAFQPEGQR